MPEIWVTSDTHFGHKNILVYEKEARPFASIEEMNERIIENWNGVVAPKDTIYHLGDFAFGRRNVTIAGRLNGNKRLILGNHDTYPSAEYLLYFTKLYGMTYFERCVLSHMPVHPESLGARWLLNVHGHLHSRTVQFNSYEPMRLSFSDETFEVRRMKEKVSDENYFNVAVEQNNLTPFNIDVIRKRLEDLS
jgi:calcineurin-like phosphoesterase family protein